MAFHPNTGLVYVPTRLDAFPYKTKKDFTYDPRVGVYNLGLDVAASQMPEEPVAREQVLQGLTGALLAWDPAQSREVWRIADNVSWNGGVLVTAGNLLFQGQAKGHFVAYRADNGERLWDFAVQTGVMAGPVSYAIDSVQFVAVAAGWGSGFALLGGRAAQRVGVRNVSRILAFKLAGEAELPPQDDTPYVIPEPPPMTAAAEAVTQGRRLYHNYCFGCHGDSAVSGRVLPDLRHMTPETHAQWQAIVLGGVRQARGMVSYSDLLSVDESAAIHAYVIQRAHAALTEPQ